MDAEGAGYHFTSAPIEQHLKIIFANNALLQLSFKGYTQPNALHV
jgi:hypothetical protein